MRRTSLKLRFVFHDDVHRTLPEEMFSVGDGADAPETIKIDDETVEHLYFTTHYHLEGTTTQISQEFVKKFKEKCDPHPLRSPPYVSMHISPARCYRSNLGYKSQCNNQGHKRDEGFRRCIQ